MSDDFENSSMEAVVAYFKVLTGKEVMRYITVWLVGVPVDIRT
jgi:hypothetical protein